MNQENAKVLKTWTSIFMQNVQVGLAAKKPYRGQFYTCSQATESNLYIQSDQMHQKCNWLNLTMTDLQVHCF